MVVNIDEISQVGDYEFRTDDAKSAIYNYFVDGLKKLKQRNEFNLGSFKLSIIIRDPMIPLSGGLGNEIPCVTINRVDDTMAAQAIGNVGGEETTAIDETSGLPVYSIPFTEVYEIRVWATTAEMRDDIYLALKKIAVSLIYDFEKVGLGLVRIEGGKDEADHNFLPSSPIFWASFNINLWNSIEFIERPADAPIEKIKSVDVEVKKIGDVSII